MSVLPEGVLAQVPDSLAADTLAADSLAAELLSPLQPTVMQTVDTVEQAARPGRPSPGGAFLRSMLVPGWGQAASGAYSRAVFYVLLQSATAFELVKTQRSLTQARDRVEFREAAAERLAIEQGISDLDSIQAFIDADEGVEDARALEEGRTQQREDWLAFGIFMVLLGGADAFVSAHLSDFPEALTVEATTSPIGRPAAEIRFAIPWSPGRWPGARAVR